MTVIADAGAVDSRPAWLRRALWAACALFPLSVLGLARWLTPDPSGMGTHRQLGLPPCGFLALTSLPCPACGLTTAFAHMARLEITSAVRAHPLGLPLFLCTWLALVRALIACVRAEPFGAPIVRLRLRPLLAMMALSAVLTWVARIVALLVA